MATFPSVFQLQNFFPATFLCFSFFFLFIFNVFITTYASDSKISYNEHCSSIISKVSTTKHHAQVEFPYLQAGTSYHIGGDRIFGSRSSDVFDYYVVLSASRGILETTVSGVYRVQASLVFRLPYKNFSYSASHHSSKNSSFSRHHRLSTRLRFILNGFWSEPARKLCMVGRAPWQSEKGELLNLKGVLKLNFAPKNSTIFTSFVKGSLESLSKFNDPRYFEPIKIVSFPSVNDYDFKLESGCVERDDIPQIPSISLAKNSFCSVFSSVGHGFELQYASDCVDGQNCSPFERDIAYLPQTLSLYNFQCFEEQQKLRYLMKFSNLSNFYGTFDSRTNLLGEASWDRKKNQLCAVACKILYPIGSPADPYVDDCSTRLSLRFPAKWTIKETGKLFGEIWTNKTTSDPGYFKSIRFKSSGYWFRSSYNLPGQKYVYTQVDLVQHSCYADKQAAKNGKSYPNLYSSEMSFDFSVKQSNHRIGWGQAMPISVNDNMYQEDNSLVIERSDEETYIDEDYSNISKPTNISYKLILYGINFNGQISSLNSSLNSSGNLDITAEGVYNPQTGVVCMVGCRELISETRKSNKESLDCEILVNFEFPPLYSTDKSFVEGFIYTKRKNTDPLYFKGFNITSTSFNAVQANRSVWRLDLEIIMALISNTFAVIFFTSQILYVKKYPEKLPFISLTMLGILTLGHLIPLVLNFEALFLKSRYQQNVILRGAGWLEVNEVSVRVVTLVAFLLLFRLLQMAWTARLSEENGKAYWKSEKHALFVSLPVYIIGGLISLFVNLNKTISPITMSQSSSIYDGMIMEEPSSSSILKYLSSYAGLILDGYLFPQILLNMFQNSRENALSPVFYVGTTLVRVLPHGYDLYRIHSYIHQDFGGASYIYANHTADFYSIAWDVIIPCVCALLALIIFLQQRFGGNCILPKKLREVQLYLYEKVPVESNE